MAGRSQESRDDASTTLTWGVGAVAERLGIAQATLRTWERRYDLGPSLRTSGGHRRYTAHDIERVEFMRRLLHRGVTPRQAAQAAHDLDSDEVAAMVAGERPGDARLGPEQMVEAISRAVLDVDASRLSSLFGGALRRLGVVQAWDLVLTPVLVWIGEGWSHGTIDIVSEHVASERLLSELRLHSRAHAAPLARGGVVLASAEDDQHSLPVYAIEAALAERGIGSFVLGPRVPWESLSDLAQRTEPDAIFVWATLMRPDDRDLVEALAVVPDATRVVLGGPGWVSLPDSRAIRATSLTDAIDHIVAASTTDSRDAEQAE